ncbi:MAG: P27 family phage terminase small subunit [Candidatus Onthoplasma sp.]
MDKWEKEMIENNKRASAETERINNEILQIPSYLTDEEKVAYGEIVQTLKDSIKYRLSSTDAELIWQYCQIKIMRDRAWREYNKNPDRYIRIVTGICSDGKTPKVMVKENEHYKTLIDCNKQLEKILKDLRLTPEARAKKRF